MYIALSLDIYSSILVTCTCPPTALPSAWHCPPDTTQLFFLCDKHKAVRNAPCIFRVSNTNSPCFDQSKVQCASTRWPASATCTFSPECLVCAVCASGYGRGAANHRHRCTKGFKAAMYLVIALLGACTLVVLALLAVYLVRTHAMQTRGSAYIVLTSLGGRLYA